MEMTVKCIGVSTAVVKTLDPRCSNRESQQGMSKVSDNSSSITLCSFHGTKTRESQVSDVIGPDSFSQLCIIEKCPSWKVEYHQIINVQSSQNTYCPHELKFIDFCNNKKFKDLLNRRHSTLL